jgi:predicted Rossmann fold flavoprotein
VLATGGKSRPETGSTGDGFKWLAKIGHRVDDSTSALVPVAVAEPWVKKLQGMAFPKAKITLLEDGEKRLKANGKLLFTHFGVSGPLVLNMSSAIGEAMRYSTVSLLVDLFPDTGPDMLNKMLQESLRKESNRKVKNMLSELVPAGSVPVLCGLAEVDPETFCHSVTRDARLRLCGVMKGLPLTVTRLLGTNKAVVTKGGVALEEVDFKTMRSRLFKNLYLVGDVLDIDRPTGGYSLQLCWTTGRIAGLSVG